MAQEIDVKELKRHRRAKKRKRFFKKLLAVLLIAIIGAAIYYTRDKWLPFFDGIATRYLPAAENDGELAEGNFPLKVDNTSDYQLGTLENYFALLDDTNFSIYTADGEKTEDKQHGYSNPVLYTNSKKALIYDAGGKNFSLESKYKTVYTKKTDNSIILARLNNNDNVAVVTKSDEYICVLKIYNGSGDVIFTYKSYDRIIDVTFTIGNDGIIVTTIGSNGGQLISNLHKFSFGNQEEIWVSQNIDTMVISTYIRDDGTIVALGDTKCAYYNNSGEYISSYPYKTQLIDYDNSDSITVLLFENQERRKSSLVMIGNIKEEIKEIPISEDSKHVIAYNDKAVFMTDNAIQEYTINGTNTVSVNISDVYNDFHKLNNYIFLLGNSEINRIDFNS